ncbi:MAG: N-acetyltransferase [Caulobacteraceae bacterium]|nr:N-acetyltransferase [Caulobacteraceae bacterium]
MSFRDAPEENRMSMDFADGEVWVDYARQGDTLALLHVEADPALRGSGAAGRFMQAVVDHARAHGLKLRPVCSYAVVWMRRHSDSRDVAVEAN